MAVTHQAIFGQTPKRISKVLAAANTARDGSGTIQTVATIGSNGGKILSIESRTAQATAAANSALVVCWWYSTDGGTTWNKLDELLLTAITTSNTALGSYQDNDTKDNWLFTASTVIGVSQTVYAGVQDRTDNILTWLDY